MIPGEVDQYRNVTVGSCILAQPAIWSLICVTDTFLRTTNLCRRGTFSRDNIISRHLTLSCPPPCVSPVQVHLCNTVSHCVTPVQVHLCHTVSLQPKSICVRRLESDKDFICRQKRFHLEKTQLTILPWPSAQLNVTLSTFNIVLLVEAQ